MNFPCPVCHHMDCPGCSTVTERDVRATRQADAFRAFDALGFDAGELAGRMDAFMAADIARDPMFALVLDERDAAYRAHLEAMGDPEGMVWDAGIRP